MEVGRKMWARFRSPNLESQSDAFARTSFFPFRLPERWDFLNLEAAISHQRTLSSSSSSRFASTGVRLRCISDTEKHAQARSELFFVFCFLPESGSCKQELSSERGAAGVVTDHPTLLWMYSRFAWALARMRRASPSLFHRLPLPRPPWLLSPIRSSVSQPESSSIRSQENAAKNKRRTGFSPAN